MAKRTAVINAQAAADMVGKLVRWSPQLRGDQQAISTACLVVNRRWRFSHWDLLIVPLVGNGARWVVSDTCVEVGVFGDHLSLVGVNDLQVRVNAIESLDREGE